MSQPLRLTCALAALWLWAAPAARAADRPPDAWITTKVKMALLTEQQVDGLDIDVDTFDGRVTLHGPVDSEAEKQQAEQAARRIGGVREVRNLLAVVPAERRERAEIEDEELRRQVSTVLERDQALAGSDIEVKSVTGGTVVLAGRAKTLSAHRRALEDARSVQGVRHVASQIESPDELADEEIYSESPEGETGEGAGLARAASDTWLTTKVKIRLLAEPGVSPFAVNVDARDGIVTLFGTVGTEDAKRSAEAQAKQVQGVQRVENELQVVPDVAAERTGENDDEIRQRVERALAEREALADADVDVTVKNGVVRLTGSVASQADRVTALSVARSTPGAKSVLDHLDQKAPTQAGAER